MNKWSFNNLLLNKLPDVLDISGAEIARRCGMKQQVFNRYTNSEVGLSVKLLIKICNSLRMPAYYFVSENNRHVLPERESATLPPDCWKPIEWDLDAVERTFGDGDGRIYWKDAADAMGVTEQKPHDRFRLKTRFPVDDFLQTCNRLNLSPYKFLIDHNRSKSKSRQFVATSASSPKENAELTAIRQQLARTNATVASITRKYDELLRRHTELLDRHNELERRFNDLVGDDSTLMAAEDTCNSK